MIKKSMSRESFHDKTADELRSIESKAWRPEHGMKYWGWDVRSGNH